MLPKSERLNLRKDFKWAITGKLTDTKYAKLYLRTGENQIPRIGIATASKTFKKATERNRARRLISQALQSIYNQLPSTINILVLPKQAVLGVKSGDVLLELQEKLKDAKIIN